MILRRVISHFRHQEWTAIFLDFLIVVVGVFVGLQVNNWNETRQARAEEHAYLQRLRDDIVISINGNAYHLDVMARQYTYSSLVLENLRRCDIAPADRDTFASGLFLIGKSFPPMMVRGVINELNATGKFQYIRNPILREKMTNLIDMVDTYNFVFNSILTRATPHVVYIESQIEYRVGKGQSGLDDILWEDINVNFDDLCKDRRFRNAVSVVRLYTDGMEEAVAQVLAEQRAFKAQIEKELGVEHDKQRTPTIGDATP